MSQSYTPIDSIPSVFKDVRNTFYAGKSKPLEWRLQQLRALARMLEENKGVFEDALKKDMGRPPFEASLAEVCKSAADIREMAESLPKWVKPTKVTTPLVQGPGSSMIYHDPKGVVLIIGAWNYPFSLTLDPLAAAIAGGNCVILKPSEVSVNAQNLLVELLPKYLDTDAIKVVTGAVPETTKLLEQKFDHIFYTGNSFVGKLVMKAAAEHLASVTLELGGKSPVVLDKDVSMAVSVRRIVVSKFMNYGQTCIAPDYVLVHNSVKTQFLEEVQSCIQTFYGKNPQESSSLGRMVNERHFDRVVKLLESQQDKVVCGGSTDRKDKYIEPTVLMDVDPESALMKDEIFGPLLPVMSYDSIDEAITFINEREKPLALYVYSNNSKVVERVLNETSSGGACVNDSIMHIANTHLPFGGTGFSGMGAYHGYRGFKELTHEKSVLKKATFADLPIRYPPYTARSQFWAERLVFGPYVKRATYGLVVAAAVAAAGIAYKYFPPL